MAAFGVVRRRNPKDMRRRTRVKQRASHGLCAMAEAPPHMTAGMDQKDANIALEYRTMDLTRWANLAMGIAGVLAAWASNSQAMLMDGLFSLIG